MKEIWRQIKEYPDYMASNLGRIKSLRNNIILKPSISDKKRINSYVRVNLFKDKNQTLVLIHRIIALVFIPNPENKLEVNHIDCNPLNNAVSNLEWATRSENVRHTIKMGRTNYTMGETNHMSKLKESDIPKILKMYSSLRSQRKVASKFGVTQTTIKNIINNKTWKHYERA